MAGILFPSAQYARSLSGSPNPSMDLLMTSISSAINVAINNSLFSCEISVNGYTPLDVQTAMGQLQALGYTIALTNS